MADIRRTLKKTSYALIFFGVVFVILLVMVVPSIIRFASRVEEPPPPTESIIIESVDTVTNSGRLDIIARVRNPNPRDGVPNYAVEFILVDKDNQELSRIKKETYLLPGSLNYIAALDVPLDPALVKVRIDTSDEPIFRHLPEDDVVPNFLSFERDRSIKQVGTQRIEIQKGVVTNRSRLGYRKVDVTGVALDKNSNVIGVSTTFIGDFLVGEQREFTLQWPVPSIPTERVLILPSTNIYAENNILQVTGDANRLRESDPE